MLRASYNEQINGFGFTESALNASVTSTSLGFDAEISTVTKTLPDMGSIVMRSLDSKIYTIGTATKAGIGVLMGLDKDTRECYSYSMAGIVSEDFTMFGYMGILETAQIDDTVQDVKLLAYLPTRTNQVNGTGFMESRGFVRPSVLPSSYGNIANVVGLVFGLGMFNESGGALATHYHFSFEVQRWVNPDIQVHTPVV